MPSLLKTKLVDVKADGALKVGHKEHGPCVPLVRDSLAHGRFRHVSVLICSDHVLASATKNAIVDHGSTALRPPMLVRIPSGAMSRIRSSVFVRAASHAGSTTRRATAHIAPIKRSARLRPPR